VQLHKRLLSRSNPDAALDSSQHSASLHCCQLLLLLMLAFAQSLHGSARYVRFGYFVVSQGLCTTEDCPYAHVKVDPNAPVCQEFVSGHCPRGVSCTKKHLTSRMIRQLRQSKALQASRLLLNDSAQKAGQNVFLSFG